MFADFFLLFLVLYALLLLFFTFAAAFSVHMVEAAVPPTVSVVIAARDEERNIGACLESMARLRYPAGALEVIVVDDHSTDRTAAMIAAYAERDPRIRLVQAGAPAGALRGKANAVSQGIDVSRGEVILLTDADCTVPEGWVEDTVKYYADGEVGLVAGFTELRGSTLFAWMQALDWFALFSVAAATARVGVPVTAVGNNLSVRRRAYDAVGGFRGIPFSVTEDYALVHAIATQTPYRVRFPMDPWTLVRTEPCTSIRQLYHQKKRWFAGGRDMDAKSIAIFGLPYLFNLLLVLSPFLVPAALWLPVLGLKCLLDLGVLLPALIRFKGFRRLAAFPLYEVYYLLYVLLYPPLVLLDRQVVWKDRAFTRGK